MIVPNACPNDGSDIESRSEGDALDAAIARARARRAKRTAEIFQSPEMLDEREFGSLVNALPEKIQKWRVGRDVLALEGAGLEPRYPRWQITDDARLLPGLREIAQELGSPWVVYRFLLQSHPELQGKSALECLKVGRVADVVAVARAIAQGSFS
jgi:hypothetical protein